MFNSGFESVLQGGCRSVTDDPIFKMLYSEPQNLQHFSDTKQKLPHALLNANKEFQAWIVSFEPGPKLDYGMIQTSIDKLGQHQCLEKSSPGLHNYLTQLLLRHSHYCDISSQYYGHELWMRMVDAYYTATGDITFKSLFPVREALSMQNFLNQATIHMTSMEFDNRKRTLNSLRSQMFKAEAWLVESKNGKELKPRLEQLKTLNTVYEKAGLKKENPLRQHNRQLRTQHNTIRRERRAAIKAANLHHFHLQLGREGHMPLDDRMAEWQVEEFVAVTTRLVADQLPLALERFTLETSADTIDQMAVAKDNSNA